MTHTTTDAAEARALNANPRFIYLQPQCSVDPYEGRQWCEDDVWEECDKPGCGSVRYVRADLATAEAASGAGEREEWQEKAEEIANACGMARHSFVSAVDRDNVLRDAASHLHFIASLPPATDPAMVTVPKEPTEAMMAAWESACPAMGWDALQDMSDEDANRALVRAEWSAMLAAAPTIPATGEAMADADAEVARIMAMSDEQILAEANDDDIEWARRFKAGLRPDRFANDAAAKALYDSWSNMPGWVPWVERGNSDMQERARREATIPATGHAATEGEGA